MAGYHVIAEIAKPLTERIQQGRRVPTLLCGLVGAGIGATSGVISQVMILPVAIIGGLVGAAIAAGRFRRPARILGAGAESNPPRSPGMVLREWVSKSRLVPCVTILFEHAVYTVLPDDHRQYCIVREKLARGQDPEISSGRLIWLDSIESLEAPEADEIGLAISFSSDGQSCRGSAEFPSAPARNEFISILEEYYGSKFSCEQGEVGLVRATAVPLVVLILIVLLSATAIYASAYWTAHPPPPPVGRTEQDPLVKFLVWLGPLRLLLAGAVPFLISLGWLLKRTIQPPRVRVMTKSNRTISGIASASPASRGEYFDPLDHADSVEALNEPVPSKRHYNWGRWALSVAVLAFCLLLVFIGNLLEQSKKQAAKQEKLEQDVNEQVKAVREGKVQAGEAFRRLFGIEAPKKDQPKQGQ